MNRSNERFAPRETTPPGPPPPDAPVPDMPGGDVEADPADWPAWCDNWYFAPTEPAA